MASIDDSIKWGISQLPNNVMHGYEREMERIFAGIWGMGYDRGRCDEIEGTCQGTGNE